MHRLQSVGYKYLELQHSKVYFHCGANRLCASVACGRRPWAVVRSGIEAVAVLCWGQGAQAPKILPSPPPNFGSNWHF